MKKMLLILIAMILALSAFAFAETDADTFATIGDAMASDGFTGKAGGTEDNYIVAVELEGKYVRAVAEMDDEGRKLGDAIHEAEDIEAAFEAYDKHIAELPVAYTEVITAEPEPQEVLDALVGKSLSEIEKAGYEISASGGSDAEDVVYTVTKGMFDYDLTMNESYDAYQESQESGEEGSLTVKTVSFVGLSQNAADINYLADGTFNGQEDFFDGLLDEDSEDLESLIALFAEAMDGEEDMDQEDDDETTGHIITPNNPEIDIEALADGEYPAAFEPAALANGALTFTVYWEDTFDIVEISRLAAGDTLYVGDTVVDVETLGEDDGDLLINGGLDNGGVTLRAYDEDNCWRAVEYDDQHTYMNWGETTLPLSGDVIFTDGWDIEKGPVTVTGAEAVAEAITGAEMDAFIPGSTTVRVADGQIVEIVRVYIP